MAKRLALIALLALPTGFQPSAKPLPTPIRAQLKASAASGAAGARLA